MFSAITSSFEHSEITKNRHRVAPIFDAIAQFRKSPVTPFTTPGHKLGNNVAPEISAVFTSSTYGLDISISKGLDDRTESKELRTKAERLAADAYGADECYFSVNGSSLSVHTAVVTAVRPGQTIALSRNIHRSAAAACIFAGANPVFIENEIDPDEDIEDAVAPETVERLLNARPDVRAVFVVSPTYYGSVADVKSIAEVCHKKNVIFIADCAWAPHFGFHSALPQSAISDGADLMLASLHKFGDVFSQGSVILANHKRIDPAVLRAATLMFESTSADALIMGSIDAMRRDFVLNGEERLGNMIRLHEKAASKISQLSGIKIVGPDKVGRPGTSAYDPSKLVMNVSALNVTGYAAVDWLFSEKKVSLELADEKRIAALITTGDSDNTVDTLCDAIKQMVEWAPTSKGKSVTLPPLASIRTQALMNPRDAFFSPQRDVHLESAEGEIAAEIVSPYPPGIPRILPGEQITRSLIEYFKAGLDAGMHIYDANDQKLNKIRIVDLAK